MFPEGLFACGALAASRRTTPRHAAFLRGYNTGFYRDAGNLYDCSDCRCRLAFASGWRRLVTEVGADPAWKEPKFILIQTGIPLVWLACAIICFLKGKPGSAIVGIGAGVVQEIGLPPIGGYYILNLFYPLWLLPIFGAMRLARPDSYWAYWFYRRNPAKYFRAVQRFGMEDEYADLPAPAALVEMFFRSRLTRQSQRDSS